MRILILENNLMWSERLRRGCKGLGHEPILVDRPDPQILPDADAAILNLGISEWPLDEIVAALKSNGCRIIAHAGHKEKELLDLGRALEIDRLATNSELTHKLDRILAEA